MQVEFYDEDMFAVADDNNRVAVFRVSTGTPTCYFKFKGVNLDDDGCVCHSLGWSPDGRYILDSCMDDTIQILDSKKVDFESFEYGCYHGPDAGSYIDNEKYMLTYKICKFHRWFHRVVSPIIENAL